MPVNIKKWFVTEEGKVKKEAVLAVIIIVVIFTGIIIYAVATWKQPVQPPQLPESSEITIKLNPHYVAPSDSVNVDIYDSDWVKIQSITLDPPTFSKRIELDFGKIYYISPEIPDGYYPSPEIYYSEDLGIYYINITTDKPAMEVSIEITKIASADLVMITDSIEIQNNTESLIAIDFNITLTPGELWNVSLTLELSDLSENVSTLTIDPQTLTFDDKSITYTDNGFILGILRAEDNTHYKVRIILSIFGIASGDNATGNLVINMFAEGISPVSASIPISIVA